VKPISRSHWDGGFGADSGPSRGDPCRPTFRPTATHAATIYYVRFTPIRDVALTVSNAQIAVMSGRRPVKLL
jgi:hypothetical protein